MERNSPLEKKNPVDIDDVYSTETGRTRKLTPVERAGEGAELLKDHLEKIQLAAKSLSDTLEGLSHKNPFTDKKVTLTDGSSFKHLVPMLSEAYEIVDAMSVLDETEAVELKLRHEDLGRVGRAAQTLYERLQSAMSALALFNAENEEKKYTEANVALDQDSLMVARSGARAIAERSARIDIDVVMAMQAASKNKEEDAPAIVA